jgi:hypothetical protein
MVDLLTMQVRTADKSGDLSIKRHVAKLRHTKAGTVGVLTFPLVSPDAMTRWVAASIGGISDLSTDAVRVRLSNGVNQYYIDASDNLLIKPVTDTTSWSSEYSGPNVLGNLDLWTKSALQVVVCLFATKTNPTPTCESLTVVVDLPAWEGAVSQTLTKIAEALRAAQPILVHEETLTETRSTWKIGNSYSERGYNLTELVQVSVDNKPKSASLVDGIVTLHGPGAASGSVVKIAVKYQPNIIVRAANESRELGALPIWILSNLVQNRSRVLTGRLTPVEVSGVKVYRRMLDLQVTFRGVGHRQVDALAMRAAALSHFSAGIEIVLDSCRSTFVSVDDSVEVSPRSGESFPEAVGQLRCILHEYTAFERLVNSRVTDDSGDVSVQTTTVSMTVGESDMSTTADSSTIDSGRTSTDS